MSDPSPPARRGFDAIALTLCALGLPLSISLFDTSGSDRFSPLERTDWTSVTTSLRYHLFESFGLAAYFFLGVWWALAGYRFVRPTWLRYARRVVGGLLLVVASCVVLDRWDAPFDGPNVGNGGTIGAVGSIALERNGSPLFGLAVLATTLLLGLVLAVDPIVRTFWNGIVLLVRILVAGLERLSLVTATALERIAALFRTFAGKIGGWGIRPYRTVPAAENLIITPFRENERAISKRVEVSPSTIPAMPIHSLPTPPTPTKAPTPPPARFPRAAAVVPDDEPAPPRPYDLPSLDLLDEPVIVPVLKHDQKLIDMGAHLEKACADFGLNVKVVGIHTGPVITQYELSLEVGTRVSKITSLADDLAMHLSVSSVRIVAPIPGKNTVGIEVPNEHQANVRLKELAVAGAAKVAKMKLPLLLGKDSEGRPLIQDLADMPHLLVAGRTGTGKSVCLNSIIISLLLTRRPDECKLIMLDPKQVELAEYGRLPHLMHPVVTDNKKAEAILSWGVDKMEERYEILRRARVRNIAGYNELTHEEILKRVRPVDDDERERVPAKMPYIVIVVDEVGDLMMAMKKEVEGHIIRLAQKSRAAGIHLILTTQRPTVDVITGLIKSNLPARICFQVADRSNSRVVLDEMGAEKLLGKGDMLYLQPNTSTIIRAKGTFVTDDEIHRIVARLEVENPTFDSELMHLEERIAPGKGMMEAIRKRDELYEEAIEIVIREGRGSVSLLQRVLGIGYGRSARLIGYMAEDGIVGHYNGAQAREVLFNPEQWEEMKNGGADPLAESA